MSVKAYQQSTVDWRGQLRKNQRKTRQAIALFFLIYVGVGALIDVFLYASIYPQAPLGEVAKALLSWRLIPYATLSMGGAAFLALMITYAWHNKLVMLGTHYYEITPESVRSPQEKQLYNVVSEMKVAAGLNYLPRIYIIDADYMNAFASGFSEKSAMVAITRGLMEKLNRSEMQAVMAHELSHIRHLDIKITLTVAVLTNIMLIAIDVIFYNMLFSRRRNGNNYFFLVIVLLRYLLPLITVVLTFYISRKREFMADAGCVELMRNNEPLASALLKIEADHQNNQTSYRKAYGGTAHEDVRRAAYIFDPVKAGIEPVKGMSSLFSTHPSTEQRLKAIGFLKRKA